MKPSKRPPRWIWLFVFLPLSGCEMVQNLPYVGKGLPEAESKAIGAGCRHAGRAIEDCYAINPRASRSGVFAGWRDMNDYMATNKIAEVKPLVAANEPPPPEPIAKADDHESDADHEDNGHGNEPKATAKHGADDGHGSSKTVKATKESTKQGDKHGDEHAAPEDKKKEKASSQYVSDRAERPPTPPKPASRPRWEPGKKDLNESAEPKVWERKSRQAM